MYPPPVDCGWTIEEAVAKGCEYDLLGKAWMPAACSSVWKEEYVNLSSGWKYYTKQVDGEVIDDISHMVGVNMFSVWDDEGESGAFIGYL